MQNAMCSLEARVREAVLPLVGALGFTLIDVNVFRSRGAASVKLVIYREQGVGIEDCASISRQIHPRLELIGELGDCSLEVSSPGIGRQLKRPAEYRIFMGKGATVLLTGESEWISGILEGADDRSLFLRSGGAVKEFPLEKIKRVKLALVEEEEGKHVL